MDFGVFNLMAFRDSAQPAKEIIAEAVEHTCAADELGFGTAWFAEHHFSNYCICPSPLMMIAHCAPLTKQIKLASGLLILPLYSPARLLSEIAIADAVCDGRLILGIGSGYQPYEFDRFGVDLSHAKEMLSEFVELIDLASSGDFFSYSGKYYSMPKTHVAPRGMAGAPPIWLGGDSEETYRLAARRGYISIFSGRTAPAAGMLPYLARCQQAFRDEGKDAKSIQIGTLRHAFVTDSRDEARHYAECVRYQLRLAGSLRRRQEILQGTMLIDRPMQDEATIDDILANLMIGDPELVAERAIAEIRVINPVHMSMYFKLAGLDQRLAMRSMERFATQVIPLIEKQLGPVADLGPKLPARRGTLPAGSLAIGAVS